MFTESILKIPFSVIGRWSLLPTSNWLQEKCARINLSQMASSMILQNHRRLPVCIFSVKSPLWGLSRGLLDGFSKLASNFNEQSETFCSSTETKNVKTISPSTEGIYYILLCTFKNIHLVTQSLKTNQNDSCISS